MQKPQYKNNRRQQEDLHKINGAITAPAVRLVGENITPDIYSLRDAIRLSDELGLDLIEISPTANPPVCKIADYQKFLYDLKKKEKERKAKSTKVEVKEIRLGPNTDDHDFEFKLKHAQKFLETGCKVKVDVFFRGRSIVYKDKGEIILLKFAQQLEEYGKVESMPKLEGKRMIMMMAPLAKKK
ncbi:translation initiation factor IF-3 [Bacteroidales bacterium OttesenSCG-928-L14]|nr:translation initiation factor IF-3 [Bacteroidales bacterium OttesenSCG-928-L14]